MEPNTLSYALTPFITWFFVGSLKFAVNTFCSKQLAFGRIGYGGLPSNHSAIVSSIAALIVFKEGINHPAFGVALGLAFIVMLDASSLRRKVGQHAAAINKLHKNNSEHQLLRERLGHSLVEIVAGMTTGIVTAYLVFKLL